MTAPAILSANDQSIAEAGKLLREGKLVAFPTETVYGLGANALDDRAVAAIYAAKGRPQINPLIAHFPDTVSVQPHVMWCDVAERLADRFWPGPLTLVLPRTDDCKISRLASAGMESLAVRVPAHMVAQKLLKAAGVPVVAPSANRSGKLSPTTPTHVVQSLGDRVDMILAGGKTTVGVESTVVSLMGNVPAILRHGGIAFEALKVVVPQLEEATIVKAGDEPGAMQSPGMLESHYAPSKPIRLNAQGAGVGEGYLAFGPQIGRSGASVILNLSEGGDLTEAAANLFAMLHQLDGGDCTRIVVAPIPNEGLGMAINDRLRRAAHNNGF